MTLTLKDLHAARRGDNPNWVHNCQNGKNHPHSPWASTLTKVAPLGPRGVRTMWTNIHNTHVIYGPLVHASGVHEGAEHGARRAENVENCSKWPKMRTLMCGANEAHARLGPECAIGLVSSHMRPTHLLGVAQTPLVLGMAGLPSEPMIRAATVCQAQGELFAGSKICWAPKYVPSYHTWLMMSIERNVEIHGRHLTP